MANNFTEQDIRAIVRDEFRQMAGANQPQDIQYLPTAEAVVKLNYTSGDSLRKAVEKGILRIGYEVQDRRDNESDRAVYYFNIPACIKRLNTPPGKRKA